MMRFIARLVVGVLAIFQLLTGLILLGQGGNRGMAFVFLAVAALLFVFYRRLRPRRKWRGDPPSERQISFAEDLGIKIPRNITKGQLSDMISEKTGKPPLR